MAIDFFNPACQSQTDEAVFGIIDTPPSTLSFDDNENWICRIENDSKKVITHTAIDDCLQIPFDQGGRCDSMLTYDDVLIFIELKDRNSSGWAGKARDQLVNTISLFEKENKDKLSQYREVYGHIANKQRPYFKSGLKSLSQKFKDETGFILRVSTVIKIE